jgi:hypothetical protein
MQEVSGFHCSWVGGEQSEGELRGEGEGCATLYCPIGTWSDIADTSTHFPAHTHSRRHVRMHPHTRIRAQTDRQTDRRRPKVDRTET